MNGANVAGVSGDTEVGCVIQSDEDLLAFVSNSESKANESFEFRLVFPGVAQRARPTDESLAAQADPSTYNCRTTEAPSNSFSSRSDQKHEMHQTGQTHHQTDEADQTNHTSNEIDQTNQTDLRTSQTDQNLPSVPPKPEQQPLLPHSHDQIFHTPNSTISMAALQQKLAEEKAANEELKVQLLNLKNELQEKGHLRED
eukprot:CAMPEP_0175119568 /NCGR_PEP_ID=MMETSP0087-20121206/131_1 /TAXON_ID=136419 /ORGANISM="Unknown Unknown, Strain D1" /LENGTH=198 /DNA_ID=CAMNT_0016400905 /DNA_START=208 /DNA_END=805 /DNA_ORIENTATION=-